MFEFFPQQRAGRLLEARESRISAWAYVLVAANVAIVYVFAGATKTEARWASGAVLREVTRGSPWFQYLWSRVLG